MRSFGNCPLCNCNDLKKVYNRKWVRSSFVKCKHCSLIFQNPQEDQGKTSERYGQEYFDYEKKNETNFFHLIELTLNDFNIFSLIPEKSDILEIGCATGLFLKFMKEKGYNPVGVEICGDSAEYGIKNHGVNILNCRLEEAVFDRQFDFIHFSHLIEHLNDPFSFLKIVYGLLKPGGYAVVTTPNSSGIFADIFYEDWRCIVDDHLFLFNKSNLKRCVNDAGFDICDIRTWGGIPAGKYIKLLKRFSDRFVKLTGTGDVVSFLITRKTV